jgi:hypothetical protein
MSLKRYKAVVYVQVDESEAGSQQEIDIRDYCADAVRLDVDTEEFGNPCGLRNVEIDWATLALVSDQHDEHHEGQT